MPPELSLEDKLGCYEALLRKWQRSINLVSRNTIDLARHRHIDDSLQLLPHISESCKTLIDFGSGAGFPAMVIAMAKPDIAVSMIESDQRKCTFLSTVSRETHTPVNVINTRIESAEVHLIPDMLTARALASLDKLCGFALPYMAVNPDLEMLFMKGARADEEIAAAQETYRFTCAKIPSETDENACILRITNLSLVSGS